MTKNRPNADPKEDAPKTSTERAMREYRIDHEEVFIAREAMQRSKLARVVRMPSPRSDYGYHHLP